MKKYHYVTLFNSNYLSRGLVLYHSLKACSSNFHLYVIAFDEATYSYFLSVKFPHLTVISLKEFEDQELLGIKASRSAGEYCWTCTPSTILYCIQRFDLDHCTYLDADMKFFSNPSVLIEEMGNNSVLITDHRYTKEYDQSAISGKYCVQFMCFKNSIEGLKVLNWWREACIDWCYAKVEDGKFGDQKYLDGWTEKFQGIHELKHLGGGLAPWNVQQYKFNKQGNKITGTELSSNIEFDVVFFHFHGLKYFEDKIVLLTDTTYKLSSACKHVFYKDYVRDMENMADLIERSHPEINSRGVKGPSPFQPLSAGVIWKYYLEGLSRSKRNILGFGLISRIRNHHYFKIDQFI